MKVVRRCRTVTFVAASLVLLAACGSAGPVDGVSSGAVESTTGVSFSTETPSSPESPTSDAVAPAGTLTLQYAVDGPAGSAEQAVNDVMERAAVMGVVADVRSVDAGIEVVIRGVAADQQERLGASIGSLGATAQVRPVLSDCMVLRAPTPTGTALYSQTTLLTLPHQASDPTGSQVLPILGANPVQACQVGPSMATGAIFDDAEVREDPVAGVVVVADLRAGAAGEDAWNAAATACFERSTTCPSQQLAIEVDGTLVSVATVQTPEFFGSIQISGSFDRSTAAALAETLRHEPVRYSLHLTGSDFVG